MKAKDVFMYTLGAVIVIGFFVVLSFLIYKGGSETTLSLILGALIGAFSTVVSYFYGSSKGSAEKNELLKK